MADFDFVETDSAKLYTTIIGKLMEYCNEPLYPGDERRIFGEALVQVFVSLYSEFNDKMQQRTLRYARGAVLDAIGDRYGVSRAEPAPASATFRFSLSAVQEQNVIIPAGTRITTNGDVYFVTQEAAVIVVGASHVDLLGVCSEGGEAHNGYEPGMIATLVDLIPYVQTAVNITTSAGGDDGEPYTEEGDNKYRERIRLSPYAQSTAGPESAYRYFALSADPGIVDCVVECPEDEPNTVNLYPIMSGGELPDDEVLRKVLEVMADDVRPMTDKVQAFAPSAVEYGVEIKYYCTREDEAATIQAVEGSGGAIDQYNAWQTAALKRDINPDQLRRYILAPASGTGALRVDIIRPAYQKLTKTQIARFSGPAVVSHEVVD